MSFATAFLTRTLDFLVPPLCLNCDGPVGTTQTLCPACWADIHFITTPFCACCGGPFDFPVEDGTLCGSCATTMPVFSAARAAMLYDDASKKLVLRFKHSDRIHPVAALAAWMHRASPDFWQDANYIVPVPLHRWRLFKRRYNQAALLAQSIGKKSGKPVLVDALRRLRATPFQGHMNRKERMKNIAGAIGFNATYAAKITGKNIILIDDVLTTGATVEECSRILLQAGAAHVKVLTLARVRLFS